MPSQLRFRPHALPLSIRLHYEPTSRALRGEVQLRSTKSPDVVQIQSDIRLGPPLKTDLFRYKAQSVWTHSENPVLIDYLEENLNRATSRQWGGQKIQDFLDPLSFCFSFFGEEALQPEPLHTQLLVRAQKLVAVNLRLEAIEERVFSFLGNQTRRQLVYAAEVPDLPAAQTFQPRLWIDKQLRIPTSLEAKVPMFGTVAIRLVDFHQEA